jgi:hypothetical protein
VANPPKPKDDNIELLLGKRDTTLLLEVGLHVQIGIVLLLALPDCISSTTSRWNKGTN